MKLLDLLSESFFNRQDDHLKNLIQSFKSLFVNMKDFEKKHNIDFFKELIKNDLSKYAEFLLSKYEKTNIKRFKSKFKDIIDDIDYPLIDAIGIEMVIKTVNSIFDGEESYDVKHNKTQKILNDYINSIEEKIEKTHKKFLSKVNENDLYDPLNSVNINRTSLTQDEYSREKYLLQIELLKLQEWVKENNKRVVIVLEGRDGAGKSSSIKLFSEYLNPKSFRSVKFYAKEDDKGKDWFSLFTPELPKNGEIVIFDRSWYNRAVVEPVMGYCDDKEYKEFIDRVNGFENDLIDNDTILIKVWLSINKETQKLRFELRQANPLKYWKYSDNDNKALKKWDDFTKYINKMFKVTNTKKSPWIIINADDHKKAKLDVVKKVLNSIDYDKTITSVISNKKKKENLDTVIFLDIDGPLIPFEKHTKELHKEFSIEQKWNKEAVNFVNELVNKTKSKVVITSYYREVHTLPEIETELKKVGFKYKLFSKTPVLNDEHRGDEIYKWLSNYNINNFVIIDDENHHNIPDLFPDNFVRIKHDKGIREKDYNKALKILNGENNLDEVFKNNRNIISEVLYRAKH